MIFEKDGVRYTVTDKAHIDCFKSKGWTEVAEKTEKKSTKKPTE